MITRTNLKPLIKAQSEKRAIAHFNVSTIDMLYACVDALEQAQQELGAQIPMYIGVAESERDWMGEEQFPLLIKSIAHLRGLQLYTNADHTYSVERACKAIDAGYDMVIIDFADKPYQENISATKAVTDYRNHRNPECIIEAELGFIGSGSQMRDSIPEGVSEATMTKPDEAREFVEATRIDCLAPSIGNIHGIVKSGNPSLNPMRVREIREAIGDVPMVLHGGSGSSDHDFLSVIDEGISLIHISSELRKAYKDALITELNASEQLAPYKYLKPAREAVKQVALNRIKLFWRG